MPDDLTTAAGIAALAAGGVALLALLLVLVLWMKLRRVRARRRRCSAPAASATSSRTPRTSRSGSRSCRRLVEETFRRVEARLEQDERRIQRSISKTAVIRYDAYGEMSGRQSSSMALLDDNGTGVVLSSILHREQARMYVKGVREGRSEIELSPRRTRRSAPRSAQPVVAETRS